MGQSSTDSENETQGARELPLQCVKISKNKKVQKRKNRKDKKNRVSSNEPPVSEFTRLAIDIQSEPTTTRTNELMLLHDRIPRCQEDILHDLIISLEPWKYQYQARESSLKRTACRMDIVRRSRSEHTRMLNESKNSTMKNLESYEISSLIPITDDEMLNRVNAILLENDGAFCELADYFIFCVVPNNIFISVRHIMQRLADYRFWNKFKLNRTSSIISSKEEVVDENYILTDYEGILELMLRTLNWNENDVPVRNADLRRGLISFFKRRVIRRNRFEREENRKKDS